MRSNVSTLYGIMRDDASSEPKKSKLKMFSKKLSAVKSLNLVVSLLFIFVGHAAAGGLYHCNCLYLSRVNVGM